MCMYVRKYVNFIKILNEIKMKWEGMFKQVGSLGVYYVIESIQLINEVITIVL